MVKGDLYFSFKYYKIMSYGYINLSLVDMFSAVKPNAQTPPEALESDEEETILFEYLKLSTDEIYVVLNAYEYKILSARYTIDRMFNRDPSVKFSRQTSTYNERYEYSTIYKFNKDYKCLFDGYKSFDTFCSIVRKCFKTLSENRLRLPFKFAFNVGPFPVVYLPKREDPTLDFTRLKGVQLQIVPAEVVKNKTFDIVNVDMSD